jgi:hypothetical protein
MPATILFTPTSRKVGQWDDGTVWAACSQLNEDLKLNGDLRYIGCGNLGQLHIDGGTLYIVGHGCAGGKIGAKIGTRLEAVGGQSLVELLTREGLPKCPRKDVTIYLLACASGASVKTKYFLWKKDPYAQRFANYLAGARFNNYFVVGFAGIMRPGGQHSLNYHFTKADERNWQGRTREDAPQVKYRVSAGWAAKVEGDAWEERTEVRMHLTRRPSVIAHIERAGGG